MHPSNRFPIVRLPALLLLALVLCLGGCASPIRAKVTSFNVWPAAAQGATFSYLPVKSGLGELEQVTYESYVRRELEALGLRYAEDGHSGRFLVELTASGSTRQRRIREPVYRHYSTFVPPVRDPSGRVLPGYWTTDPFGGGYVGDREYIQTVYVNRIQVRLLDVQAGTPGKPRAVFESSAVAEGDNEDLADLVPYLVRAVFLDFPGTSGRVRWVRFDPKTGAVQQN